MQRLALVNRVYLQAVSQGDREIWLLAADSAAPLLDDARHERYYALLRLAHGTGDLMDNVDLHVMAHTIGVLLEHTMRQFIQSGEAGFEPLLQTLGGQTAQLVTPYLRARSDA